MPTRLLIADLLIALMVCFFAALIAWKWYHAFHRSDRRRRLHDAEKSAARPVTDEADPGAAP